MLAFACEPDFGSEPEVGWRWATELSRFAQITVLTDEGHRPAIEAKLEREPSFRENLRFEFFGPGPHHSRLYRWFGYRGYYRWWMREVRPFVAALHKANHFDLMHHVTYAGCRFDTALWDQGAPVIWGPVGGLEPMPFNVIPWAQPKTALFEVARNIGNQFAARHLRKGSQKSAVVLASTRETQDAFKRAGVDVELMPTIGIEPDAIAERQTTKPDGPLRIVFAGRLLALKGIALALEAVARVPGVVFTIIGDGPFGKPARKLVEKLHLGDRVHFRPPMKRPDLIREYAAHHALIYPSFHDSGGFVVIEAMAQGLPVICLDCGGPGIAVTTGCGVKVPLGSRETMIHGLAAGLEHYRDENRAAISEGENARRSVEANYHWARKAEKMAGFYGSTLRAPALRD